MPRAHPTKYAPLTPSTSWLTSYANIRKNPIQLLLFPYLYVLVLPFLYWLGVFSLFNDCIRFLQGSAKCLVVAKYPLLSIISLGVVYIYHVLALCQLVYTNELVAVDVNSTQSNVPLRCRFGVS